MKHIAWFFTLTFATVTVGLAAQPPGLDAIALYNGTWRSTITRHATMYSKPSTQTSVAHNDCWRSGDFYACHQTVDGKSMALIVYTFNAATNTYRTSIVTPNGTSAGGGTLIIAGNRWTYPWIQKDGNKTVYFRVVNIFTDPNTIVFRSEFSYDQHTWTRTGDGIEHRQ